MHSRSTAEFHGFIRHLYIGDRDICHLCQNALCIRLDLLSAEPHGHMYKRIKGANRSKCQSHGVSPLSCILSFEMVNSSLYTFVLP